MMIGGPDEAVQRLDPIFKTLAPGREIFPRTPGRESWAARLRKVTSTAGPRVPDIL